MKRKPLTYSINVIMPDGEIKKYDELTPDENEQMLTSMSERLSRTMSEYYSNHMDEYAKI